MIKTKTEIYNVRSQKCELPMSVKAFTFPDRDGNYYILINDRLSDEAAEKAYMHEIKHIGDEDFLKDIPGHILN